MGSSEMGELLGIGQAAASAALKRLHIEAARTPQRVHITQWVYDRESQRRYPRPQYAIGVAPDAKKPKVDLSANRRRSRQTRRDRMRSVSVFTWGQSLRSRGIHL